jgi:hypothetical protein
MTQTAERLREIAERIGSGTDNPNLDDAATLRQIANNVDKLGEVARHLG